MISAIINKFLVSDGLNGLNHDSTFIVFEHQACLGDCKNCFLDKKRRLSKILADSQANEFTHLLTNPNYITNLDKLFKLFKVVDYTDDLRLVNDYPVLKQFTTDNSNKMKLIAYTDSSAFTQYELSKEYSFYNFADISFSQEFIKDNLDNIKDLLSSIYNSGKSVSCMKLIVDSYDDRPEYIKDLLIFISSLGIHYKFYTNVFKGADSRFEIKDDIDDEHSELYAYKKDIHFRIFDHSTTYISKSKFMLDLPKFYKCSDTDSGYAKYENAKYDIIDLSKPFTWSELAVNYLLVKLDVYRSNYNLLLETNSEYSDDFTFNYFKEIPERIQVNTDFNFIPYKLLGFNTNLRELLREEGFIDIENLGLYKPDGGDTIIPIFDIKE